MKPLPQVRDVSAGSEQPILPRLMYIGDQPIEASVAGPAQLHKLLEDYPADRLCVVESNIAVSKPALRLKNVPYQSVFVGLRRLQFTRVHSQQCSFMFLTSGARWPLYASAVRRFRPEAILTISHGTSWVTAAAVARRFKLPLHLVLHDAVADMSGVQSWLRRRVEESLGRVYRQAVSRMCIGPLMESHYRDQFGVPGRVLYPTRSVAAQPLADVRRKRGRNLVFAYAGSIHYFGGKSDLEIIAAALESLGHTLLVYSPACAGGAAPAGLNRPNVIARPPIPGPNFFARLASEADVFLLTMSFEQPNASQLSFPSKLADYTLARLPILLRAPAYSSAAKWARDFSGSVEVVDKPDLHSLLEGIKRLESDEVRRSLGEAAGVAGDACFSRSAVVTLFHESLQTALF